MKKLIILSLIVLLLPTVVHAQATLKITYVNNKIKRDSPNIFSKVIVTDIGKDGRTEELDIDTPRLNDYDSSTYDNELKNILIRYNDKDKQLIISNKNDKDDFVKISPCKNSNSFVTDEHYCPSRIIEDTADATEPPYPYFSNSVGYPFPTPEPRHLKKARKQRIFIIDARPILNKNNNTLYKLKKAPSENNNPNDSPLKDITSGSNSSDNDATTAANPGRETPQTKKSSFTERLVATNTLPLRSSMTVFIEGYNFYSLENLTISVAGMDYNYNEDIGDLYTGTQTQPKTHPTDSTQPNNTEKPKATAAGLRKPTDDSTKYKNIYFTLKDNYDAMNINDLIELNDYKAKLDTFINRQTRKGINLSPAAFDWYSRIMRWSPTYLGLTPLNVSIPDNDEIAISMNIKNKNESTPRNILLGSYRGSRGIGVGLGSMVHVTGLKNHEAYTDTSGGKKFARLDKTGKSSVGLGLNVEMLYRTGSSFCPAFNVGFFVPFDEDLTPFLVFGPGINIGSKNVSLGITGGAALGKINAISGRFKDRDLTGLDLTNEQLTQKVWKWGWQVGIGLRFNIATSKQ